MIFQNLIQTYQNKLSLVTRLASPVVIFIAIQGMKSSSEKIAKEAAKTITSNITKPFSDIYLHNYYLPLPPGGYSHHGGSVTGTLITQVGDTKLPQEKPVTLTNGKFLAETAAVARPDLSKPCTPPPSENIVPFNFTNAIGKIMGFKSRDASGKIHHIVTPQSPHVIQGKESLAYFCSYFKNVPLSEIGKDPLFLAYHDQTCLGDPSVFTRAFQLALEVSYSKRRFLEQDIDMYFNGYLSINDIVGKNEGVVDISTVYSVLQIMHMKDHQGFPSEINVEVIPTTIRSHKGNMENLSSYANKFIAESKAATGNTTADVILGSHIYDFKPHVGNYNHNHIIFLDYSQANILAEGKTYLYYLHNNFTTVIKTNKDTAVKTYIAKSQETLKQLIDDPNINTLQKIQLWNEYVYHTWAKRPTGSYLPILIPTTKEEFIAKSSMAEPIKEITLPTSKTIEPPIVLGSLKTVINKSDEETQHKAWIATKGVLGKEQQIDLNNNISREEVD